jgi:GNAT superfamily N-acetyltransferase
LLALRAPYDNLIPVRIYTGVVTAQGLLPTTLGQIMQMILRAMTPADKHEVADLIYASINTWYRNHGCPAIFRGEPQVCDVFYDVYEALDPGHNVVAQHPETGRLMGSCFYHPRKHHVSLGIMTVHPNYAGLGVGRALLQHIIDFTEARRQPLRLTQSAINVDSFSLYNKAGFVPRYAYQDMLVNVPESGIPGEVPGGERVRDATLADVPAMAELEWQVSNITREPDYRYCIENRLGCWHGSVLENRAGGLDGFLISCSHPAMNMLGPGVARDELSATALLHRELNLHRGRAPVVLIPVDKSQLVRQVYAWGGRNVEMHFCQVLGPMQPFNGVNLPSFLPETG